MDYFEDTSKYIYHYTSAETLVKYILPQKQLLFSSINISNDPEESKYHMLKAIDDDGKLEENIGKNIDYSLKLSKEIIKNVKTICFSQDGNVPLIVDMCLGKGYKKPRMWAQYANNSTGVCLAFNKENIIENFNNQYENIQHFSGNVSYGNQLTYEYNHPYAETMLSSELQTKTIEEIASLKINEYFELYYFSKHIDWQTENEFRLVIKPQNTGTSQNYLFIDGALEKIILGNNFDEAIIPSVKILSSNFEHKPQIIPLVYNGNNYTLDELIKY